MLWAQGYNKNYEKNIMQKNFYKITKAEAFLIGRFEYLPNKMVDPFMGEQKDGTYLVSEKMYKLLNQNPNFQKVDFTKLELIDEIIAKEDLKLTLFP